MTIVIVPNAPENPQLDTPNPKLDSPLGYCEVADLIAMGIAETDPPSLSEVIQDASRIIDNYCRTIFGIGPQSVTLNDVRDRIIPLPRPFADVTAVTIDGFLLDPLLYGVDSWGIRIFGSFPLAGLGAVGNFPPSAWPGAKVTVTATFGWPEVPRLVQRACRLLCQGIVDGGGDPIAPGQTELAVGDYRVAFSPSAPHLLTTGNVMVDRLLEPYRIIPVMVA